MENQVAKILGSWKKEIPKEIDPKLKNTNPKLDQGFINYENDVPSKYQLISPMTKILDDEEL